MTSAPRTLGLIEAAALLRIHKDTLQRRARAGAIPGAKIGKQWVFLEADLVGYLKGHYQEPLCPSTNVPTPTHGGSISQSLATPGYADRLNALIAQKRSASTMRSKPASGPPRS